MPLLNEKARIRYIFIILLFVPRVCISLQASDSDVLKDNSLSLIKAVEITMQVSPVIRAAEQRMEAAAGLFTAAGGQFNTVTQASTGYAVTNQPYAPGGYYNSDLPSVSTLSSQVVNYQLGLSKLFRTGVQITPSVQSVRFSPKGENQQNPNNSSILNLAVTIPLMRGLGVEAAAAQEIAASHVFDKTRYELWQVISTEIQKTANAYWSYVAESKGVKIWGMARDRNAKLLADGERLAIGDVIARSDLNNYRASLAMAESEFSRAQKKLIQARYDLGIIMGISSEYLENIPLPIDDFPEINKKEIQHIHGVLDSAISYSITHRNDILAAEQNIRYFQALLVGAENSLKPLVNLQLNVGYEALSTNMSAQGIFTDFGQNINGPTGGGSVSYQFPFENDKAIGQLKQSAASLTEAQIIRENLSRVIFSAVQVSANDLKQGLRELEFAQLALTNRDAAFEAEKRKQLAGLSTVINVVYVAQNLTDSQLALVQAAKSLASSIVNFRFATATIFSPGDESRDLDFSRLTTIPNQFEASLVQK